jgi:hypothetical protein
VIQVNTLTNISTFFAAAGSSSARLSRIAATPAFFQLHIAL